MSEATPQRRHLVSTDSMPDMPCEGAVEVVVHRFGAFGRLAHFRQWLMHRPGVTSVRIAGYASQTAVFALTLSDATTPRALTAPGTRLVHADGSRVELRVDAR